MGLGGGHALKGASTFTPCSLPVQTCLTRARESFIRSWKVMVRSWNVMKKSPFRVQVNKRGRGRDLLTSSYRQPCRCLSTALLPRIGRVVKRVRRDGALLNSSQRQVCTCRVTKTVTCRDLSNLGPVRWFPLFPTKQDQRLDHAVKLDASLPRQRRSDCAN